MDLSPYLTIPIVSKCCTIALISQSSEVASPPRRLLFRGVTKYTYIYMISNRERFSSVDGVRRFEPSRINLMNGPLVS